MRVHSRDTGTQETLISWRGFDIKNVQRTKVEQIKRIVMALVLRILVTEIRLPTPNQKGSAGEHGTMSVTWTGNVPARL